MDRTLIGPDESPEQLSARLGRPVCMLLRANRLFSVQWLLPGRRIRVPDAAFCANDAGICPVGALRIPAENFVRGTAAPDLPKRLGWWSRTHGGDMLPQWSGAGRCYTVRAGDDWQICADRSGVCAEDLRRCNRLYGGLVPGMVLWVPFRAERKRV